MDSFIEINFGTPEHGWLPVYFRYGEFVLEFEASDAINDPLEELYNAVISPNTSSPKNVTWFLEPGAYVFEFEKNADDIKLTISEGTIIFGQHSQLRDVLSITIPALYIAEPVELALRKFCAQRYDDIHWGFNTDNIKIGVTKKTSVMEQFKIREGGFVEIRKATLLKSVPLMTLAVIGGIGIGFFNMPDDPLRLNVLFIIIPIVTGALLLGIYMGLKRQKILCDSYTLTIDNNGITREQHNTQTITVAYADIREIIKNSDGSFTIKGNSNLNAIQIPAQIAGPEKLEILLSELRPLVTLNRKPFSQKFSVILALFTLLSMAGVALSNDKLIVGVSGLILVSILGYSFVTVQKSKNVDAHTKRMGRWLLLVILSIAATMYFKLNGSPQ